MNLEELIERMETQLFKTELKTAKILFFDFLFEQTEVKKPCFSDWQKIRDLFLSDQNNQQLAFQILEAQDFQELKVGFTGLLASEELQEFYSLLLTIQEMKRHDELMNETLLEAHETLEKQNQQLANEKIAQEEQELLTKQREETIETIMQITEMTTQAKDPLSEALGKLEAFLRNLFD